MDRTLAIGSLMLATIVAQAACGAPAPASDEADLTQPAAVRIDTIGHVEVSNFMLCMEPLHCDDVAVKDRFNREDPFHPRVESYEAAFQAGLSHLDSLDGDEPDFAEPHPLIDLVAHNFLLVDVAKDCTVDTPSYFEIEQAAISHLVDASGELDYATCGGRTPNDDAMDTTLTLMINGPDRLDLRRSDGVDAPAEPASNTFPYLAPPHRIF